MHMQLYRKYRQNLIRDSRDECKHGNNDNDRNDNDDNDNSDYNKKDNAEGNLLPIKINFSNVSDNSTIFRKLISLF